MLEDGVLASELKLNGPTETVHRELATGDEDTSETIPPDFQHEDRPLSDLELLRRERRVAEWEIRLLRRELELARLTPSTRSSSSSRSREVTWKDIKEMAGDFDGNNSEAETWVGQIKKLIEVDELDGHVAQALICHKLKGKTLKWYHSKPDCVDLTYQQLLDGLLAAFGQRPNVLALRRDFEWRVWKVRETFSDYVHDKLVLGNRVPIADNEMIDYLIEGIPDAGIRSMANVRQFRNVEELVQAYARSMLPEDGRRPRTVQRKEDDSAAAQGTRKQQDMKSTTGLRCFNCNGMGYYASECEKPKRDPGSCFKGGTWCN